MEPVDASDLWPERYEPDWTKLEGAKSERVFVGAAFELLKEAGCLATLAAAAMPESPRQRNDAILCGHLVRMAKLAISLVASTAEEKADQHLGIIRQIFDSATTILYLMGDDGSGTRFDAYVADSLIADREFLKVVRANENARGESLPIEERIYRSIKNVAEAAGLDIDAFLAENKSRASYGWPSAEERMKLLGPNAYPAYRMGSHAVHGTWTDLFRNHLVPTENGFEPNFDHTQPRPQALLGPALVLVNITQAYVDRIGKTDFFRDHLEDLIGRVMRVDELHESLIQGATGGATGSGDP